MTKAFWDQSAAWLRVPAKSINHAFIEGAREYQNTLTKPPGALGRLETLAIQFCGFQAQKKPQLNDIQITIFAGDHGVCCHRVSPFPQAVTAQMVQNFIDGGAAISVLSQLWGADLTVVDVGVAEAINNTHVVDRKVAKGTRDFTESPAMTLEQCMAALSVGRDQVTFAQLFIGGEMGIGNTTAASAIYAAVLGLKAEDSVGPGAGLPENALDTKRQIVQRGLQCHKDVLDNPLSILQCLGGFEIAALVGSYITAAQAGVPVLVDGFISSAAALIASRVNPSIIPWLLFAHQSAEPAHQRILTELTAEPLLNLGLRLGEGSGAALAIPLIQSALQLHNQMATFAQAGVAGARDES